MVDWLARRFKPWAGRSVVSLTACAFVRQPRVRPKSGCVSRRNAFVVGPGCSVRPWTIIELVHDRTVRCERDAHLRPFGSGSAISKVRTSARSRFASAWPGIG